MRLKTIVTAFLLVWPLVSANVAVAHPLGNFSISQYSALRVGENSITIRYVIDMAEIPTFQEIQESGIVPNGDDPNTRAYLEKKAPALGDRLSVEIGGQRLTLHADAKEIAFPPGAGGLPTLKIGVSFQAALPANGSAASYSLDYRDGNFTGRAGWKEIVATSGPGALISYSSAPRTDRSAQLGNYPTDLLNSPPQQLEARIDFIVPASAERLAAPMAPGLNDDAQDRAIPPQGYKKLNSALKTAVENEIDGSLDNVTANQSPGLNAGATNRDTPLQSSRSSTPRDSFTELMATKQLGWNIILVALAVAVGLGAFHALEPGHGKTLVAAYLVGSRGTMKHALLLGLIVTAAHTAGVYLMGGVALYAAQHIVPDRVYPWLEVISGVMIAVLGAVLFIKRFRVRGAAHSHRHGHGRHAHPHEHEHKHVHGNRHVHHGKHHLHGTASARELLTLGISGGIVPCPAALVVLLSGVSMNRAGFGLLLIVAFSAGLAGVLIAIGMLMVHARNFMSRFQSEGKWVTRWLPITSSAFIVLLGVALTWKALQTTGLTQWGFS
jgi:ABC-type nickel/cobalt efflux system permease component RcnA